MDTSGSMNYGNGEQTKLNFAKQLCGTLAYLAAQQGDAIGLYCAGEQFDKQISPKRSSSHLKTILDELETVEATGGTGLVAALHEAAERIRQRALVIIVSDLFVEPKQLGECFQHLRFRKHDAVVFHIMEQKEIEFDFDRPIRFNDLERGAPILADPSIVANDYRKAVQQYLVDLQAVMRDAAVDYQRIGLGQHYGDVLAKFLLERAPKRK